MDPKSQIDQLTEQLNHYTDLYYTDHISVVSDQEFDMLLKELEVLENKHPAFKRLDSPTARVGGSINKNFETVEHKYPMLSLSNTYNFDEIREWDQRVQKALEGQTYSYICEIKFDGISLSLTYEKGILVRAITRGDGTKGDDITANVRTIKTLPLRLKNTDYLPEDFEVRGEGFMPLSAFERLNREKELAGEATLANPRNTAAGTFKLQDSTEVARRGLDCYLYHFISDAQPFTHHSASLEALKKTGFNISNTWQKVDTIDAVLAYIENWKTKRHDLPCATDGIVVKIDDLKQREILGFTAKSPRWAISYKYKADSKSTLLKDVSFQVGRTGAITPVAELAPVDLAGSIVKRATLHNSDEIIRLGIKIGDAVFVEKAGEIIPKITAVDHAQPRGTVEIQFPKSCPSCGTAVQRNENEAAVFCPNIKSCKPQILGRIEHFIQRKAMNIDSLGEGKLDILFENGLVSKVSDLYLLKTADVLGLEKVHIDAKTGKERKVSFKEKTTQNIIDGIEKSKTEPFNKVLYALGIRFVGETTAEKIADHFKSIDAIKAASFDALIAVPEVGERIANSVVQYFTDPENLAMLDILINAGLSMQYAGKEILTLGESLKDKTLLYTGTFESMSREQLEQTIAQHGGKLVSGVSKKLDYLIVGDGAGPSKVQKANDLGVKMIDEKEFLALLD